MLHCLRSAFRPKRSVFFDPKGAERATAEGGMPWHAKSRMDSYPTLQADVLPLNLAGLMTRECHDRDLSAKSVDKMPRLPG